MISSRARIQICVAWSILAGSLVVYGKVGRQWPEFHGLLWIAGCFMCLTHLRTQASGLCRVEADLVMKLQDLQRTVTVCAQSRDWFWFHSMNSFMFLASAWWHRFLSYFFLIFFSNFFHLAFTWRHTWVKYLTAKSRSQVDVAQKRTWQHNSPTTVRVYRCKACKTWHGHTSGNTSPMYMKHVKDPVWIIFRTFLFWLAARATTTKQKRIGQN